MLSGESGFTLPSSCQGQPYTPNHRVAKSRGPISLLYATLFQPSLSSLLRKCAQCHCELSLSPTSLIWSHQSPPAALPFARTSETLDPPRESGVASPPAAMDPAPAVAAELWRPPHLAAGGGRAVEATSAVTEKSSGGRGGGGAGRRRQRETPASEDDSSRIVSTSGGGGQDLVGSLPHWS